MLSSQHTISQFSKHLFWDVNREQLDIQQHKHQVIQQVLEYGLLSDWLLIRDIYGIKAIGETSITFRQMDPKTLVFISVVTGIPKESFICYSTKQLIPGHWNF